MRKSNQWACVRSDRLDTYGARNSESAANSGQNTCVSGRMDDPRRWAFIIRPCTKAMTNDRGFGKPLIVKRLAFHGANIHCTTLIANMFVVFVGASARISVPKIGRAIIRNWPRNSEERAHGANMHTYIYIYHRHFARQDCSMRTQPIYERWYWLMLVISGPSHSMHNFVLYKVLSRAYDMPDNQER